MMKFKSNFCESGGKFIFVLCVGYSLRVHLFLCCVLGTVPLIRPS